MKTGETRNHGDGTNAKGNTNGALRSERRVSSSIRGQVDSGGGGGLRGEDTLRLHSGRDAGGGNRNGTRPPRSGSGDDRRSRTNDDRRGISAGLTDQRDVIAALTAERFTNKGGTRHDRFVHPDGRFVFVPRHRQLKRFTAKQILEQAKLTETPLYRSAALSQAPVVVIASVPKTGAGELIDRVIDDLARGDIALRQQL